LLKAHGLPDRIIENMMDWHHSGFNVYCGPAIWPGNDTGIENLARYIIRAAFSQERMRYIPATASADGEAKVIYQSKDGRERKVFPALEWLAQLSTHIPNRREQMVRYYGFYSNKSRGQRIKAQQDSATILNILEPVQSDKASRKSWARLIQKIYEVDPLCCPKCRGPMKIISIIEEQVVIKQILQHLGLWEVRNTGPPPVPRHIVREPTHHPVRDHAPGGDEVWSQVPNYGYWAK